MHKIAPAYNKKLLSLSAENESTIAKLLSGASRLHFVPSSFNVPMTVIVEGENISLAPGTIWVPAAAAQRFDVCQNQIQCEALRGSGELTTTFFCGNMSLPTAHGIPFIPTPFTLKGGAVSQSAVWEQTDPRIVTGSREQALKQRISKLPTVMGSGGTETLARVTAVSGRWLEIQTMGNIKADVATVVEGWAHAFLERGPWRGVSKLSSMSKSYDVAITVEQYFVPGGGDGDNGFWILADVTGSVKKADLVGFYLSVAFLPSMGLPKLPPKAVSPPKDVVAVIGVDECLAAAAASAAVNDESSCSGASAGGYWTVSDGAKRSRTGKAAMHSGDSML